MKSIAQALAEMAAEHIERAYAFSPNSYTWTAVEAIHAVLRGKPEDVERLRNLNCCAYAETEIEKGTDE